MSVWKVNLGKPCKRVMIQSSSNTWLRQIADVATSDIGTMDSFTQKVQRAMAICLVGTCLSAFTNASEQRLFTKMKSSNRF